MSAKINDFKIGFFTFIGLGLVVTGLLVFGAWSNFKKTSSFETYMAGDVSGLSVGSAVELRGVQVGKVTRISFSWNEYQVTQPSYIVVEFEIQDDTAPVPSSEARWDLLNSAIQRGLRARLKNKGITGTCILSLEYLNPAENPPAKFPWTPKHPYIPSAPELMGDLLVSMRDALHKFDHVDVAALDQLTETDLKSLGRVLNRVDRVDMEGLSTNTTILLTELQSFVKDADGTVKKMQLEKLSQDADASITQLNETISVLKPGLAKVDFDSLNDTLVNAQRTMRDMDDVLFELKQYPSGFIFGNPPPKLKEIQAPAKK